MDRSVKWTAVLRPPISRPFNNSLSITATFHLIVYLHFPSYSWSHLHSRHLATSSLEVRPAGSVSHSSCPGFKCSLEIRDTTGISRHQLKRFGLSNNILGRTKSITCPMKTWHAPWHLRPWFAFRAHRSWWRQVQHSEWQHHQHRDQVYPRQQEGSVLRLPRPGCLHLPTSHQGN